MPEIPIVNYELIKDLPNHPEILLVDVREIQEIKDTALIPTSINVPRKPNLKKKKCESTI